MSKNDENEWTPWSENPFQTTSSTSKKTEVGVDNLAEAEKLLDETVKKVMVYIKSAPDYTDSTGKICHQIIRISDRYKKLDILRGTPVTNENNAPVLHPKVAKLMKAYETTFWFNPIMWNPLAQQKYSPTYTSTPQRTGHPVETWAQPHVYQQQQVPSPFMSLDPNSLLNAHGQQNSNLSPFSSEFTPSNSTFSSKVTGGSTPPSSPPPSRTQQPSKKKWEEKPRGNGSHNNYKDYRQHVQNGSRQQQSGVPSRQRHQQSSVLTKW